MSTIVRALGEVYAVDRSCYHARLGIAKLVHMIAD
jgi:hypothetical protein